MDTSKLIEVLLTLPQEIIVHLQLVLLSALFAIIVGIPLGILSTTSKKLESIIIPTINFVQTIPSLAFFGLLIPIAFFGIGFKTAIFVLFIYSLLPIIKNTNAGIKDIDDSIIDAATGIGLDAKNIMLKIQIPIAFPTIFGGIRMSIIRNVGTATIASYIGAGGLGDLIFLGISNNDTVYLLVGAISTMLLALCLDVILQSIQKDLKNKSITNFKKFVYVIVFIFIVLIPIASFIINL